MPIVRIDMYDGFSEDYKFKVSAGIHEALTYAFRIPDHDRNQILTEHDDAHFERSGNKTRQFVIIEITAYKGRSREAKRSLYRRIVGNLAAAPGINPADVLIVINEPELVNWGISGGNCADEVDTGFAINV